MRTNRRVSTWATRLVLIVSINGIGSASAEPDKYPGLTKGYCALDHVTARALAELALNEITPSSDGYVLNHPSHFAEFTADGVRFVPKAGGPTWQWQMSTLGQNDSPTIADNVQPLHDDGTIVYYARGGVREEYVARANAIEQRFILESSESMDGADYIIEGTVTAGGTLESWPQGWVWRTDSGVVSLGHVYVYDANGVSIPAQMHVEVSRTRIEVDGEALKSAAFPVTIDPEVGTNDFRVSVVGTDGDTTFNAFRAAIAYNSTHNEYLVVWHADTGTGSLVDEEFEIYGQRIDAATGAQVGNDDFRISEMGTDGTVAFVALNPQVAYNPANDEYLVVWQGRDVANNGFEIYGQRIHGDLSSGDEVGNDDFQISDMGPGGSNAEDAAEPALAYNSINNEYLVVWKGDDTDVGLVFNETEIFGQRIHGDRSMGDEAGNNDFRISDLGGSGDITYLAVEPRVAHNTTNNEYLVVWWGDDNEGTQVDNETEVFMQRIHGDRSLGYEVGDNDFRMTNIGIDGDTQRGVLDVEVAYNSVNNQYLVIYQADDGNFGLSDNEFEILAQRIHGNRASGNLSGSPFLVSASAGLGMASFDASVPRASYSAARNEFLIVWSADINAPPLVNQEFEIYGQLIFGDANDGNRQIENNIRLSDMGPDGDIAYLAAFPGVAYNENNNQFGIVWHGDDDTGSLVDDEFEIYFQRFFPGNAPPVLTLPGAAVNFTEGDPATILDAAATAFDPDSANLNTGTLTVDFAANGTADDRLAIQNQGTGAGQIGVSGSNVSFGGTVFGVFAGGVGTTPLVITFNSNATTAALQALMRNITFNNVSQAPSTLSRMVRFVATDGDGGTSTAVTKTVNVTAVIDNPVLTIPGGALNYTENDPATVISSDATVIDVDSPDFDTGTLTVDFSANGTADDRLGVRNQGVGAGQIGVSGSNVTFGGTVIGTFAGGIGTTPLVVTLNANATIAATQALVRNIAFRNISDSPSTTPRTVRFVLTDGDGGTSNAATKTINVTAVIDDPVITLSGAATTFTEGDPPAIVDATATVVDVDSPNFDSGVLTVDLAVNGHGDDRLAIRNQGVGAGQIGVSGSDVTFGGVQMGSFAGGVGTTPLVITLNANATQAAVQALVRNITFENVSMDPSILPRTVRFIVTDGDGGTSPAATKTVNVIAVSIAPILILPSAPASFTEGDPPVLVDPAATVSDPDSPDFNTGILTVSVSANGTDDDRLAIRNEGTGAGQVGVSGSMVSFGGTVVGTFNGGNTAMAPLVITFNANATPTEIQAIIRNVTFEDINLNPSSAPRTITFVLTDGDGGTSGPVTQTIEVAALGLPLSPWPLGMVLLLLGFSAARRSRKR